jgi:hypothetical protein
LLAPSGSWREALDFPGATVAGLVGRILDGLPTTDMEPDWTTFLSPRGLRVPGRLQLTYQETGGLVLPMCEDGLPRRYRIVDPRTGAITAEGERVPGRPIETAGEELRLMIFCDEASRRSEPHNARGPPRLRMLRRGPWPTWDVQARSLGAHRSEGARRRRQLDENVFQMRRDGAQGDACRRRLKTDPLATVEF